jgi:hypothetical protein
VCSLIEDCLLQTQIILFAAGQVTAADYAAEN